MSLDSDVSSVVYQGSDTTGPFPITYTLFEAVDLHVYTIADNVIVDLELNVDFTVSPELDSLTTTDPVPTGTLIVIDRSPIATQPTDFTPGGKLRESVLEKALDRIVMVVGGLKNALPPFLYGSLRVPQGETVDEFPDVDGRKDKIAGFDSEGNPEVLTPEEIIGGVVIPGTLPPGGTPPQILFKKSDSDYDAEWKMGSESGADLTLENMVTVIGENPPAVREAQFIQEFHPEDFALPGETVGNDPDQDDWLAFQKAISASAGKVPSNFDPSFTSWDQITEDNWDSFTVNVYGVDVPALLWGPASFGPVVILPKVQYHLKRGLVLNLGIHFKGDNSELRYTQPQESIAAMINVGDGDFPAMESLWAWFDRVHFGHDPVEGEQYNHYHTLEGFAIEKINRNPVVNFTYLPTPRVYSSPVGYTPTEPWGECTRLTSHDGAGNLVVTQDCNVPYGYRLSFHVLREDPENPSGNLLDIKLTADTYRMANNGVTAVLMDRPFTVDDATAIDAAISAAEQIYIKIGVPVDCGIVMDGGENVLMDRCVVSNFAGIGVFYRVGAPTGYIQNSAVNTCGVAMWLEGVDGVVDRVGSDSCDTYLRCGMLRYCTLKVQVASVETSHSVPTLDITGSCYDIGQVSGNYNKVVILASEHERKDQPNSGVAFITEYRDTTQGGMDLILNACNSGSWGDTYMNSFNVRNGDKLTRSLGRFDSGEYDGYLIRNQRVPYYGRSSQLKPHGPLYPSTQSVVLETRDFYIEDNASRNKRQADGAAIMCDNGSGLMPALATFTRPSTVVTFSFPAESLPVSLSIGDVLQIKSYSDTTGSGALVPSDNTSDGYQAEDFLVLSLVRNESGPWTFNCACLNQGFTAGTVELLAIRQFQMHSVKYGEHVFQMPDVVGNKNYSQPRSMSLYDKLGDLVWCITTPAAGFSDMWLDRRIRMDGTVESPNFILDAGDTPTGTLCYAPTIAGRIPAVDSTEYASDSAASDDGVADGQAYYRDTGVLHVVIPAALTQRLDIAKAGASKTKTNDATLADDPDLQFEAEAGKSYRISGMIGFDGGAGGFQMKIGVPGSTTYNGNYSLYVANTQVMNGRTISHGTTVSNSGSATEGSITFDGVLVAYTAGTVAIQWAQLVSDAAGSRLTSSSVIAVKEIGDALIASQLPTLPDPE